MLDRLSADLVEDESSDVRVQIRMGVYSEVDKKLTIDRRFDNAKAAANTTKNEDSSTVGIYSDGMESAEL